MGIHANDPAKRRSARLLHGADVACAALFVGFAIVLTWPVWRAPAARFIGIGGDPLQTMWFLTWGPHAIGHAVSPWFTTSMNYPNGFNLMWNASQFLPAIALWPITKLFGVVVAYNVLVTGAFAASSILAYIAIRRWVSSRLAAASGAFLYGFSPFMLATALGHANLIVSAVTPPLLMIAFDQILARQEWPAARAGVFVGLVCAAQFFISEEVLLLEAVGVAVLTLIVALSGRAHIRRRVRYVATSSGVALLVTIAIVAWPLYVQLFGPGRITGPVQTPDVFVSDLVGFVIPIAGRQAIAPPFLTSLAVSPRHAPTGNPSEWFAYIGVPLIVAMIVLGLRRWRSSVMVRVSLMTVVVLVIASMGPSLHVNGHRTIALPWGLLEHVSFMQDVLPGRFILLVSAVLALLFAQFVADLRSPETRFRRTRLGLALATVLTLLPAIPVTTSSVPRLPLPILHLSRFVNEGDVALVLPYTTGGIGSASAPLYWQAASGLVYRSPAGYVTGPPGRYAPSPCRTPFPIWRASPWPWLQCVSITLAHSHWTPSRAELRAASMELKLLDPSAVVVGPASRHEALDHLAAELISMSGSTFCAMGDRDAALWLREPRRYERGRNGRCQRR